MKTGSKRVYWHRDLPPLKEREDGQDRVVAASRAIPYVATEEDELWGRCYDSLMEEAERRIVQELDRLGKDCARVIDEDIEPKIDHVASTYHLEGRFIFVLFSEASDAGGGA